MQQMAYLLCWDTKPSSARMVYIQDPNLVNTVPADLVLGNQADTVLTTHINHT